MPFNRKTVSLNKSYIARPTSGGGGLKITSPSSYQIFQRNLTTNLRDIPVRGTFTGDVGEIEARFNGGTWQTIDSNPRNGTFSGTLRNCAKGQGNLDIRSKAYTNNIRSRYYVGVGDVFIIAGQSNAVSELTNYQTYANTFTAGMLSKGYKWKPAADPMHYNDTGFDTIYGSAGANNNIGSYWILLADYLMDGINGPIAFVPCAKVGINITEFAPGPDHLDRTTLYGAMLYRTIQAGGARAVFWHQGETNVNDSQSTYYNRLNAVADPFGDDTELYTPIRTKFMPCKLQRHGTYPTVDYANVNAAIAQFWGANVNALTGADLTSIHLTTTPPEDGLHITTDAQAASAASLWNDSALAAGFYS